MVLGGSRTTMRNVAIGPRKNDAIHQFKPLLPLVCARPALMRERVNQPTAYSPVSGRIILNSFEADSLFVLRTKASVPEYGLSFAKTLAY